jgi:5-methylcytosine-specific restriction protein A
MWILSNQIEIQNAQILLSNTLNNLQLKTVQVKLGHKGANYPSLIAYCNAYDIWFTIGSKFQGSGSANQIYRYWNAFGVGDPKPNSSIPIIVEINCPCDGIYRTLGGAFAEDDQGEHYLCHRGRIGGGRKGIGLNLFMQQFGNRLQTVQDGNITSQVFVIGQIKSSNFPQLLTDFVKDIAAIK